MPESEGPVVVLTPEEAAAIRDARTNDDTTSFVYESDEMADAARLNSEVKEHEGE